MINTEAQLSLSSTGGSLLSKMAIQETNVEVTFVGWQCRTPKDPFPTDFCSGQKAIGDCNSERPNKGKSPHTLWCRKRGMCGKRVMVAHLGCVLCLKRVMTAHL